MRIAIIAANALAAEAIRARLRHTPGCQVLGYVDGRKPCGATLTHARPDVLLIDDMDCTPDVLERIREARAAVPESKLVVLTVRMESPWLAEATRAGANAAIAKGINSHSLGTLLREVAAGNIFHSFATPVTAAPQSGTHAADLTPRELEILRLVAAGRSNSRIATDLWVAEQTVKFHLSNIYRKLGVANRTEASHFAHVNGLLEPSTHTGVAGTDTSVPMAA